MKKRRQLIFISALFISLVSLMSSIQNTAQYKLIVFEGSDWCSNCIRFEKNILSDTAFLKKAEEWNIVVEKIDFPQRKKLSTEEEKHNASVAEKYSFEGIFPTIVLANSDTDTFQKINYQSVKNTEEFLNELEKLISKKQ